MNIVAFSKLVGLSTATVSRAFHEPDKVRPATREQVLALAKKMGYYPDPSGRALVKGRYDAMGLVWPLEAEGVGAAFAQRVLAALTEQLVDNDLDLLICPVDRRRPSTMEHASRTLLRSRCDAWILLYPRHNDPLIESLREQRKPVICLMGKLAECVDWKCVTLNQRSWIDETLRRLKASGARRVLFLGCRAGEPDHEARLNAFTQLAPQYFGRNFLARSFEHMTAANLPAFFAAERIDAVIGVDDAAALTALQACQQSGISVPGQMQIVGIDATQEAARSEPALATFRQPLEEMTACAIHLALGSRSRSREFEAVFVPGGTLRNNQAD